MKYLVRIDLARLEDIKRSLAALKASAGVKPAEQILDYLVVDVPPELVPSISALGGVIAVTRERWLSIKQIVIPIDEKLSEFHKLFWSNPITGPASAFKFSLEADMGKERVPTSESRKMLGADVADAEGITGKGIKVAVLDTGTNILGVQGPYIGGKSSVEGQPVQIDENGHGCATGDTSIITTFCGAITLGELYQKLERQYGSERSSIGESVFLNGNIQTVGYGISPQKTGIKAVHKIPYSGPLCRVRTSSGIFETTPWHPFLVMDRRSKIARYVRADKLTRSRNYFLVSGAMDLGKPQTLTFTVPVHSSGRGKLVRCYYCGAVMGTKILWRHSRLKHGLEPKYVEVLQPNVAKIATKSLPVDENLAYLAGIVAGDGCLCSGKNKVVNITPGEDTSSLIPLIKDLGFHHWFIRKNHRKELGIDIKAFYAMKALGLPIGKKGQRLQVPELITKSPYSVISAFLAGLVDTDSHLSKNRCRLRFITSSLQFARDLTHLLSYLGYAPRIGKSKHNKGRGGTSYQISLVGQDLLNFLPKISPLLRLKPIPSYDKSPRVNHRWIKKIETFDFQGFLYDLTTGSENYLAGKNGFTFIHNTHCQTTISGRPFQSIHGLLRGVAVDADVAAFKVLGYGLGAGTNISVLRGMMDAFNWGASILSMSLGSPYTEEPPEVLPECRAIKMLTDQGIIVVVANGNDGATPNTVGVPANSPHALSVGAVDINGNLASFSSRGPTAQGLIKPDCCAPGVNILSTSAGLIATMQFMDGPPLLAAISGTSMSCPHVSGVVALALQYARMKGKKLTTEGIKEALALYGEPKNNDYGHGLIRYQLLRRYIDEKL